MIIFCGTRTYVAQAAYNKPLLILLSKKFQLAPYSSLSGFKVAEILDLFKALQRDHVVLVR